MKNIAARTAVLGLLLLDAGCAFDVATGPENCVHKTAKPIAITDNDPVIRELPDADVTLSADVDIYVATTNHSAFRVYTMPKVDAFDTMLISKPSGYCDDNDAMSFVEHDGRIVFDISTEGYGCIGWASVVAIGDPPRWQMVEFGGSGR